MKKTLSFIALTSLATNTAIGSISVVNAGLKQKISNNQSISTDQAAQYAQETSIIPKSLLIGKTHGFNTDSLLTNLNSKLDKPNINYNIPSTNGANPFIESLTTNKLDVNTLNNIQSNFQSNGNNQKPINDANANINKYNSYKSYANDAIGYINNQTLSQTKISDVLDLVLHQAKNTVPNISTYLSYVKYEKILTMVTNELLTDWDQQSQYGTDPIAAMQKYMASSKGDIAQGKTAGGKGEWHYVLVRAQANNWNWNNFYEYMAGANLNYMIKTLSGGSYVGDLINNHVHLLPWNLGFDTDLFLKDLSNAINKLPTTPQAWPFLIKAIVPVLKEKILNMQDPTLRIKDLSWDNKLPGDPNQNVQLKLILQELIHLLSPEGKQDLTNLVAGLLSGPFGEDIIVNLGGFGYYTLPELFADVSWLTSSLNPQVIAGNIVDQITKAVGPLNIPQLINKVITFTDAYLTKNPHIDLRDLATYFNNIFNDDFNQALNEIVDIINNPDTSKFHAKDVLALLGVQIGQTDFKENSSLYWIQKWLQQPNSSINQILGIFTSKDNTGIIDNMIKEQQDFLNKNYYDYFDINNQSQFKISNVVADDNKGVIKLTYTLTDVNNKQDYHLVFLSEDKDHKNFLLHRFE